MPAGSALPRLWPDDRPPAICSAEPATARRVFRPRRSASDRPSLLRGCAGLPPLRGDPAQALSGELNGHARKEAGHRRNGLGQPKTYPGRLESARFRVPVRACFPAKQERGGTAFPLRRAALQGDTPLPGYRGSARQRC